MDRKRAVDRAVWDKKGKYRYIFSLLREIRLGLNALKGTQRYMVKGLGHEFSISICALMHAKCFLDNADSYSWRTI